VVRQFDRGGGRAVAQEFCCLHTLGFGSVDLIGVGVSRRDRGLREVAEQRRGPEAMRV